MLIQGRTDLVATNSTSTHGRERGGAPASILVWMLAGLVSVAGSASGAGLRSHPLTPSDLSRPFVLDQQGRRIAMAGGGRDLPTRLPPGVAPTYLAYRLGPRPHAPDGTPIVSAVPGRGGRAVGMLRLDALAKASLDAELAKTGQVAVMTPHQSFLVESWGGSVLSDVAGSSRTWRAKVEAPTGAAGPRPGGGGDDKSEGTIENWYNSTSDAIKNWNQQAIDAVKDMFNIDPPKPKPVIIPPKTAAQTLVPPAETMMQVLPEPVPEPGSLIIFAAGATIAAWRFRPGRLRTRHADPA